MNLYYRTLLLVFFDAPGIPRISAQQQRSGAVARSRRIRLTVASASHLAGVAQKLSNPFNMGSAAFLIRLPAPELRC